MFSARILWAVKILLVLHKASEAGTPLMKGRELQAACVGPDTDTYMYRRTLRELAAKTDYLICVFQSGRTFYQWNPNHRPTLHDLIRRLDGGMHEVSHTFWTYENTRTMQPLQKVCKEYDNLIQTYLSKIYIEELESPALLRQSRFRLPRQRPRSQGRQEQACFSPLTSANKNTFMEKQTTTDHFHPVATGNRRPGIGGSRSLPHVPDTANNTNNGLATRP